LWLLALHDLDELGEWSWGGMRLVFLYEQLSLTSDSSFVVVDGYMSLLVVIYFFLIFLVNRKCIVVCMILMCWYTCLWRRCRLRGGGVGVRGSSRVLFYEFCIFVVFLWYFIGYECNIFTRALLCFYDILRYFILLFFVF